jgi:hypothetical protein
VIVRLYIGDDPRPEPEDFDVTDSKEAAALFEEALATATVGDTIHVVAVAVEDGP